MTSVDKAETTAEEAKIEPVHLNYYYVAHSVPMMGDENRLQRVMTTLRLSTILSSYPRWWHYIDGFWVIGSEETMAQVWEKLKSGMPPPGFFVFIGRFTRESGDYTGFLPKEAWESLSNEVVCR